MYKVVFLFILFWGFSVVIIDFKRLVTADTLKDVMLLFVFIDVVDVVYGSHVAFVVGHRKGI